MFVWWFTVSGIIGVQLEHVFRRIEIEVLMREKKQFQILRMDAGLEEREQTFSQSRYNKSSFVSELYHKTWIWLVLCISLLYFSYSTCHPDMEGCLLVYVCLSVLEPQLRAGVLVSAALSTTACGLFPITYYLKQNRTKQQCQIY